MVYITFAERLAAIAEALETASKQIRLLAAEAEPSVSREQIIAEVNRRTRTFGEKATHDNASAEQG